MRRHLVAVVAWSVLAVSTRDAGAQAPAQPTRVSLLYTGRSLGALGVRRWHEEHELLTEAANAAGQPFKLVSHMAWRAPGIVIFMSGREPEGTELPYVLARRADAERLDSVRALSSANVLLLQDPWRPTPDLMAMAEQNPRRARDFPDLVPVTVAVSRMRGADDERIYIVEQPGAQWPEDPSTWATGEMNRVDLGESRLFELPHNLGPLGARATLLDRSRDQLGARRDLVLAVDLGHQEGDLGFPRADRARLDFAALEALGYSLVVPYAQELGLGAPGLLALRRDFPQLTLLAANIRTLDTTLFTRHRIIESGQVRVGVIGLVNPRLRERLTRGPLRDFTFEDVTSAARREVLRVRAAGVHAVVVLSNLDPADNAALGEQVAGIDAVIADLPVRWTPERAMQRVELPDRPFARFGTPALVARSAANGVAVGRLTLEFRTAGPPASAPFLSAVEHWVEPVTDRVPPDTALVRRIAESARVTPRPRGELMFPAFVDLADRRPSLRDFDAVTRQGRVSQPMWEAFMARLLRYHASAEVAVIRRLEQFPALIGKLHENEIDAWLWTEDQVVVLDIRGSDLLALLRADTRGELATSGVDLARRTVQGHRIDPETYYRVATVDVLFEGARSLGNGRRVRNTFRTAADGSLHATPHGAPVALRDFILGELRRIRSESRGEAQIDRIATLLSPDAPFVGLTSFSFDRPTLFASANEVRGREGYTTVPESRVTAADTWVAGASTKLVLTREQFRGAADLGLTLAYGKQGVTSGTNPRVGEYADDIKVELTLRRSARATASGRVSFFARGLFDTEVSPTTNTITGVRNPVQRMVRGSAGMLVLPGPRIRRFELAMAVEDDLGNPNIQYGTQVFVDFQRPVGVASLGLPTATYRWRNDATYFFPAPKDSPSSLALRYNMIHEVLIPLMDELSLSVAADMFVFQGKVDATRHPATSTLFRVGITYDRLWKPRYQPFF